MNQTYSVRCPNCGDLATRSYFSSHEAKYKSCGENQVLQTECSGCDYLMVTCSQNGNVIEAYSSSTSMKTNHGRSSEINPLVVSFVVPLSA